MHLNNLCNWKYNRNIWNIANKIHFDIAELLKKYKFVLQWDINYTVQLIEIDRT